MRVWVMWYVYYWWNKKSWREAALVNFEWGQNWSSRFTHAQKWREDLRERGKTICCFAFDSTDQHWSNWFWTMATCHYYTTWKAINSHCDKNYERKTTTSYGRWRAKSPVLELSDGNFERLNDWKACIGCWKNGKCVIYWLWGRTRFCIVFGRWFHC